MFSKPELEQHPLTKATFFASGSVTKGELSTKGEVYVAGLFLGPITADRLTIATGGSVKGNVTARVLLVDGELSGAASADSISLSTKSIVRGNLVYGSVQIAAGAQVDASCRPAGPCTKAKVFTIAVAAE